jgi:simple sugar transport system ATP-binding protein
MVHQHFMLVDNFTVLENVVLGAEGGWRLVDGLGRARRELARLEQDYGLVVDPDTLVEDLSVGQRQRVEILKALYRGARILILDEPTGVLTPQESDQLFRILRALKDQGVTIILITHKLREIMDVTDNVSVMRGGSMVAHRVTTETGESELAELMVGRKVLLQVDKKPAKPGDPVLSVAGLTVRDAAGVNRVDDLSLQVCSGEIVGIAGVAGNGQSELLETLSGIRRVSRGSYIIGGAEVSANRPRDGAELRRLGVAHVPEDRHRMGLVTAFSAAESSILGYHDDPGYNGPVFMNLRSVRHACQHMMEAYDVRPPDPGIRSAAFSGGNQQKLVLAREMERRPRLLLVGQPTRGVDIGAIEFIHRRLVELRDAGAAVLLVSVELEEILSLSDRIVVMFEGRLVGSVPASEADPRMLGLMMANAWPESPAGAGP